MMKSASLSARSSRSNISPDSRKLSQNANVDERCLPLFRKRIIVSITDCGIVFSTFSQNVTQEFASFDLNDCSRSSMARLVSMDSHGKEFLVAKSSAEAKECVSVIRVPSGYHGFHGHTAFLGASG